MTKRLLAFIALIAASSLYAADTLMTCQGVSRNYGHNAPKWIRFESAHYSSSGDILTVASDRKWAAGIVRKAQVKLSLCKETPSELLYSFNCAANSRAYKLDWLSDASAVAVREVMLKKYGEYSLDFGTLRIDRVNLTVTTEYILALTTHDSQKIRNGGVSDTGGMKDTLSSTEIRYLDVTEYRGTCKVSKAKI